MQDASELVVAASGDVYIAPVGTPLPTDLEAPDEAFVGVGFITPDGVKFTDGLTVEEIRAWQSPNPIRKTVTARDKTATFALQQWNRDNFVLAYGGGEWSEAGGVYRYDPPAVSDAIAEFSVIVDWADGDKNHRVVISRMLIQDGIETSLVRTGAAVLPITAAVLAPEDAEDSAWYHLTDDPSFAASS